MRAHPFPLADDNDNNDSNNSNDSNDSNKYEPELITEVDVVDAEDLGPWQDDTERWMSHQDFAYSMFLSMQLKDITCALARGSNATIEELKSLHDVEQANAHLKLIKESQGVDPGLPVLPRGIFDHIDGIIDETVQSVKEEMAILEQRYHQKKSVGNKEEDSKKRKPNTRAVASKLNKACTDYLTEWMVDNAKHPYPTQADITMLSLGCGLGRTQVNNWATNIRKRNQKATVECGKKPHGFLDFQFLAAYRDQQKANKRPRSPPQSTTVVELDREVQPPPNKRFKPLVRLEAEFSLFIDMNAPREITAVEPLALSEKREDEEPDILTYFASEWHPTPTGLSTDSKSGHFF